MLNFEIIREFIIQVRPKWPKLACLTQKTCPFYTFSSLVYSLLPNDNLFKNIFTSRVENSVDLDQLTSQKTADLDLHCVMKNSVDLDQLASNKICILVRF